MMTSNSVCRSGWRSLLGLLTAAGCLGGFRAGALPTPTIAPSPGKNQASIGTATTSTSGSQMTVNQTTSSALINWNNYNIASGESVNYTFSPLFGTPVSWNFISDANASTINGAITATKGLIILQNPNGFTVGGTATINVHNLIMTTALAAPTSVTAAGPWSFSAMPPAAQIINFGHITTSGGGSAYLIASDIVNKGTITAPGGSIGLYDGETVLVSKTANGLGLSAQVTLPTGSVDNQGNLVASAGSIAAMAQYVNQDGIIQANSALNVNGTIQLVASDTLNLNAGSSTTATGNNQNSSSGGVTLQAGNVINNNNGATVTADGSSVVLAAPTINQSGTLQANALGNINGTIGLDASTVLNLLAGSSIIANNLTLGSSSITTSGGNINFTASGSIEMSSSLSLADSATPLNLNLTAGNNITIDNGVNLSAGQDWNVTLNAGPSFLGAPPAAGADNITVGTGFIQSENGSISLWAANGVSVANAVRTVGGGSIWVTALYGGVAYTHATAIGFVYGPNGYGPSSNPSGVNLSGISTAAGGDVNITAGGDVTSFPTAIVNTSDPGIGAFGSQPGNVIINAGGSVYGNFIVINGNGTINAGQNIGTIDQNVALSLANGNWTLNAGWNPVSQTVQNGTANIYLQEVRNPNGIFNSKSPNFKATSVAQLGEYHYFDYGLQDSVTLNAGNGVHITGDEVPRVSSGDGVPVVLPPILTINAGAGGVTMNVPTATDGSSLGDVGLLDSDLILFPSPYGNLTINTTGGGSFVSGTSSGTTLRMSDSASRNWFSNVNGNFPNLPQTEPFSIGDDASVPAELNNPNPVTMNISGSIENMYLYVSKFAQITVGGDMVESAFYGENLQPSQATTLTVGGEIFNTVSFNSVTLDQGINFLSPQDLPPGTPDLWNTIFILNLALKPEVLAKTPFTGILPQKIPSMLYTAGSPFLEFAGLNPNISYDPVTRTITAGGPLTADLLSILEQPLTVARYGPDGFPEVDSSGHLVTDTITLLPTADFAEVASLYNTSQSARPLGDNNGAYVVGGMGQFIVNAGSISLGNSAGILTIGNGSFGNDYSVLTPYMSTGGAGITVNAGYIEMPASAIAALAGGNVKVTATGEIPGSDVSMDLGSAILAPFEGTIMANDGIGIGIYTSGGGSVTVESYGTINVDTSRIATFNGGDVSVTSEHGDVDAGSGGAIEVPVKVFSPYYTVPNGQPDEFAFLNGIGTETLANIADIDAFNNLAKSSPNGPATVPGNITINTPEGNIKADLGGISQETLDGTPLPPGPTITLNAGSPGHDSTVDLGDAGAIGGTISVNAANVKGLVVSQHNTSINAQNFSGTILSGGSANVQASDSVSGTIIGASGVNVSGGATVTASLLGQNVSVNGSQSQSTLGSSANATATSQAAAQQSTQSATKQVASNDNDDEKKKKKKAVLHVGRVTVILSTAVPPGK